MFVGGVDVSRACLKAAAAIVGPPRLVIGYDSSRAGASGYVDMGVVAEEVGAPFMAVRDLNSIDVVEVVARNQPQAGLVVGWSGLVRESLLSIPDLGWYGIHPTRLPEGRGRAPIPWTILKGLTSTASTLFRLGVGVDDGPIVDAEGFSLEASEDATALYARHRDAHVRLIERNIAGILDGSVSLTSQDDSKATYWERRSPEDGRIDWTQPAANVLQLIRAVTHPFPGAFTDIAGTRMTIWRAEIVASTQNCPGDVTRAADNAPVIACADVSIRALEWTEEIYKHH